MLVGVLLGHLSRNLNRLPFSPLFLLLSKSGQLESRLALFAVIIRSPIGLLDLLQIAGLVLLGAILEGAHCRLCNDVAEAIPSLGSPYHLLIYYLRQ
jgi:hypothetical protein